METIRERNIFKKEDGENQLREIKREMEKKGNVGAGMGWHVYKEKEGECGKNTAQGRGERRERIMMCIHDVILNCCHSLTPNHRLTGFFETLPLAGIQVGRIRCRFNAGPTTHWHLAHDCPQDDRRRIVFL